MTKKHNEEDVFVCSWKGNSKGFTLWVKGKKNCCGNGSTYDEAENALRDSIYSIFGTIIRVLEFDKPLPIMVKYRHYLDPELYFIGGDERFEMRERKLTHSDAGISASEYANWLSMYYTDEVCTKCFHVNGRRSAKELEIIGIGQKFDGAFGMIGRSGGPNHQIVSAEFLALLTRDERKSLILQEVKGGNRVMYEIVGPEGSSLSGVRGLNPNGWECKKCGYLTWGYWIKDMPIHNFIRSMDLVRVKHDVFTIGKYPDIQLVCTGARWRKIMGKMGSRGFASRPLGVVDTKMAVEISVLPYR